MGNAAKRHLSRVAGLGCIACWRMDLGETPAEIHHPRFAAGMAQRASDWLAVPLCPAHHRGPQGIHGDKTILRQLKADEPDLLAWTIQRLNGG